MELQAAISAIGPAWNPRVQGLAFHRVGQLVPLLQKEPSATRHLVGGGPTRRPANVLNVKRAMELAKRFGRATIVHAISQDCCLLFCSLSLLAANR